MASLLEQVIKGTSNNTTDTNGRKISVDVDVCLRDRSNAKPNIVRSHVLRYLAANVSYLENGNRIDSSADVALASHCSTIRVSFPLTVAERYDILTSEGHLPHWRADFHVNVYKLCDDIGFEQLGDGEDDSTVACQQFSLPHRSLEGLWDSLCFESSIKDRLLSYSRTSLLFSARGVDSTLISCNRVVLLYGPPGTGKTSLCRALAQTLAIRLLSDTITLDCAQSGPASSSNPVTSPGNTTVRHPGNRMFSDAQLVEINSHSLFSKWFSESGKLVQKLFERIEDLASDPNTLVFVLVDEVESLAGKRSVGSVEPSDSLRSVNALLTQLDRLSRFDNVLILATSNLPEGIDAAFLDRADIREYIGPPSLRARYDILRSCLNELARVGLLVHVSQPDPSDASLGKPQSNSHSSEALPSYDSLRTALQSVTNALVASEVSNQSSALDLTDTGDGSESKRSDVCSERSHGLPTTTLSLIRACPALNLQHPFHTGLLLLLLAHSAQGLSGRSLRKLPFQAHANAQLLCPRVSSSSVDAGVLSPTTATSNTSQPPSDLTNPVAIRDFIVALDGAVTMRRTSLR